MSPALDMGSAIAASRRRPADSRVQELLRAAADFAARSLENVVSQLGDDHDVPNRVFYDYVKLAHGLEVHFLFPNLAESERELLVSLMGARSAVLLGLSKLQHRRKPAERKEHEAVITHLRNRYEDLRAEVESRRLRQRLTSFQRRILEREFLALPVS